MTSHPLPSEPDLAVLREALEQSPVPLAKWLPSGKAAHLSSEDRDWLAAHLRAALAANPEPARDGLREAFDAIMAQHEPDIETNSDQDFGSMWMTCSCGWDQERDRVRNDYIEWVDHVRTALAAANQEPAQNGIAPRRLWCERNESAASAHGHTDDCYEDVR